jgi:hypothetical protein
MGVTQTKEAAMANAKTLSKADLQQFTGSEHWYRHGINRNCSATIRTHDHALTHQFCYR